MDTLKYQNDYNIYSTVPPNYNLSHFPFAIADKDLNIVKNKFDERILSNNTVNAVFIDQEKYNSILLLI